MADRQHLERLTKELANAGRLIEAGWVAMRLTAIPLNAPAIQLQEMRLASVLCSNGHRPEMADLRAHPHIISRDRSCLASDGPIRTKEGGVM